MTSALAALLAAAVAAGQSAQSTDDEARMHFRLGRAYHDSGRFLEAAREFETAYRLSQRPQLLYNIFVAYRDAGETARAADALARYIELVPDAEDIATLRARLEVMRRQLASSGSASGQPPPSSSTGQGEPGAGATPPSPQRTDAATTTSAAPASDPSGTAAAPSEPEAGTAGIGIAPLVVGGAGLAILATAAVTGVLALGKQSQLDEVCRPVDGRRLCDPASDWESIRNAGETLATVTDVLLVAGVLAVGTAVALHVLRPEASERAGPSAAVYVGPTGVAASVRWSF
ncbi:MAG: tetratricopeptide repeat protein [Myxococcota bacterium]|nr:tetratricopeptide repeat protein [Myxococcota bacterium]MDW8361619.1 tetratricopeptide repeat protein [Myxococcales bacterium]